MKGNKKTHKFFVNYLIMIVSYNEGFVGDSALVLDRAVSKNSHGGVRCR